MSKQKKHLAAAIMVCAAVAGGGVAGAVLGTPTTSSAQTTDTTTDPTTAGDTVRPGHPGPGLDAAATALGVTTGELRTALQDGQTIAEVAADKGIDVQTVIDAMVADATQRIDDRVASGDLDSARADELKANLADRITDMVNGELRPGGPGGPGWHGPGGRGGPGLDAAATALGISVEDLRTAIEGGQTIAEVAAGKGVDVNTVIDAMVADARERITARVNGETPEDAPTGS